MAKVITNKLKLFACAASMTGSYAAFAQEDVEGSGLFLEPGISYQMTESNVNYPTGYINSSANARGFGLVLRGGVHVYERFFVAADGRYALLQYQDNANNLSSDATAWDIAPVVGMQMKDYGARLYVGYILAGELDPRSANNFNVRYEQPNGWRVGVGLKVKHIGINLEWQRLHYTSTKVEQLGAISANTSTDAIKFEGEGLLASVTFPIEFN